MAYYPFHQALIIKREPLAKILTGEKTWEIRGSATVKRGPIGLIESGSGLIVGCVDLCDCLGPLDLTGMLDKEGFHSFVPDILRQNGLPYARTHAWILADAVRFREPVPYIHPQGAMIWVNCTMSKRD